MNKLMHGENRIICLGKLFNFVAEAGEYLGFFMYL